MVALIVAKSRNVCICLKIWLILPQLSR